LERRLARPSRLITITAAHTAMELKPDLISLRGIICRGDVEGIEVFDSLLILMAEFYDTCALTGVNSAGLQPAICLIEGDSGFNDVIDVAFRLFRRHSSPKFLECAVDPACPVLSWSRKGK